MPAVSWRHPLPPPLGVVDRRALLMELATGQRVVHVGCVDERQIAERLGTGRLLHEELFRVATELTGVDLSPDLEMLAAAVPGRYVHGNAEVLDELDIPDADVVLVPELLEHVGNPATALSALARYLRRTGATAVITTPNAYSWTHVVRFAARRAEWVHPDHRVVYTPTTLATSLRAANLEAQRWWAYRWQSGRAKAAADRAVAAWNPWLLPGMVVEVRDHLGTSPVVRPADVDRF